MNTLAKITPSDVNLKKKQIEEVTLKAINDSQPNFDSKEHAVKEALLKIGLNCAVCCGTIGADQERWVAVLDFSTTVGEKRIIIKTPIT